jgi:hypothetical protein
LSALLIVAESLLLRDLALTEFLREPRLPSDCRQRCPARDRWREDHCAFGGDGDWERAGDAGLAIAASAWLPSANPHIDDGEWKTRSFANLEHFCQRGIVWQAPGVGDDEPRGQRHKPGGRICEFRERNSALIHSSPSRCEVFHRAPLHLSSGSAGASVKIQALAKCGCSLYAYEFAASPSSHFGFDLNLQIPVQLSQRCSGNPA